MVDREMEPTFDMGDEDQVEEREKKIKLAQEREIEDLREVLATRVGRALVWRLLERCHIYHSAPLDLQEITRFEGGRDVGLWLWNECFTSNPNAYSIMQQEATDRERDEDAT